MITDIKGYIEDFAVKAEELAGLKLADCPELDVRKKQVTDLLETYYNTVGKNPKSIVLENLGSYIMVEDLKNKDVDKVTNTEFPVLSEIQIKRRARKQMIMQDSTIDFLNNKFHKEIDSLARKTVKKADY